MSADLQSGDKDGAAPRTIMPPYIVLRDFFDEKIVTGLLDYALANEAQFVPTRIMRRGINPSYRVSVSLRELGAYRDLFMTNIRALSSTLIEQLRVSQIDDPRIELELVAHGDGAFYKSHIDTRTGHDPDNKRIRALSAVYYFHALPKAFTGGALRLYGFGKAARSHFVDIEPVRNSLLAFPSWALHEVLPIACPSERFIDSRFAVNCWLWQRK